MRWRDGMSVEAASRNRVQLGSFSLIGGIYL